MGIEPDLVIVNASGGGLAAGIALAVKARVPRRAHVDCGARRISTITCARFGADGASTTTQITGSICDALMAQAPGELTFEINRA